MPNNKGASLRLIAAPDLVFLSVCLLWECTVGSVDPRFAFSLGAASIWHSAWKWACCCCYLSAPTYHSGRKCQSLIKGGNRRLDAEWSTMTDSRTLISWHFVTFLSHLLLYLCSEGYQQWTKLLWFVTQEKKSEKPQIKTKIVFLRWLKIDGPRNKLPNR